MNTLAGILRNVRSNELTGCHEWAGGTHKSGYGVVCYQSKIHKAHRFFYEQLVGQIPEGLYVCHRCHNKICVNPEHLYAGTQLQNMQDMVNAGRQARGFLIAKHKMGSRNAAAKLTEEAVKVIRLRLASGERQAALAKEYGVSDSTIHSLVRFQTWREAA